MDDSAAVTRMDTCPGAVAISGVRGWLLALCLMLTVAGPAISAWLIADEYAALAPHFIHSAGLQAAFWASCAITAGAVGFGVHAGLRLWLIRPKAVKTARLALLAGLAADVVTTMIAVISGSAPGADDRPLRHFMISMIPSLVFFTASYAYLDRSRRVEATYGSIRADS